MKIWQPGGHGYGDYAYLPSRTAEALARAGLVTLGFLRRGRRSIAWATLAGAPRPEGFASLEEARAESAAFMEGVRARREERASALVARVRARREERGAPCDSEWEAQLREVIGLYGCEAVAVELGARSA